MKKPLTVVATLLIGLLVLFVVAGRDVLEMVGYLQASADKTVDELEGQLPQDVHDRKLSQDLERVRQEIIDRKVQLTKAEHQIEQMQQDVEAMTSSLARRERLLAESYPILEQAMKDSAEQVTFASATFTLEEFQQEIDDLLSAQEQEQERRSTKQAGLARLQMTARDAEVALADMQRALETSQQEVEVLKSRREQAEIESQTIEMVNVVSGRGPHGAVGEGLDRLRDEVTRLEAENTAQKALAPVSERADSGKLSKEWSRMEELKKIHEQVAGEEAAPAVEETTADEVRDGEAAGETTDE